MEKIIAAAISYPVNDIISCIDSGERHNEIYEGLYKSYGSQLPEDLIEGFLTNTGRFVDRYEAKEIAVAANQLIVPIEETYAELYSEDVW